MAVRRQVYDVLLLFLTQRLASERDFHRRVTLAAIHDKSAAWLGLGGATKSLWNQFTVRAAPLGVVCILLYLGSIFALSIATPGLLGISASSEQNNTLALATNYLSQAQRAKYALHSPTSSPWLTCDAAPKRDNRLSVCYLCSTSSR